MSSSGINPTALTSESAPDVSDPTPHNSPRGNIDVHMNDVTPRNSPAGGMRDPRASFSTTSVVSDNSAASSTVTQQDLDACMRQMEERFENTFERLTRNLVVPSQLDEITNQLNSLSVLSPTQPAHGPYRARMGPSLYNRPQPNLGFPMPAEPFSHLQPPRMPQLVRHTPPPIIQPLYVSPLPQAPRYRQGTPVVPAPPYQEAPFPVQQQPLFLQPGPTHVPLFHEPPPHQGGPAPPIHVVPAHVPGPPPPPPPQPPVQNMVHPQQPPPPPAASTNTEPPIMNDIYFSGRPADLRDFLQEIRDAV
ncbi:uncharacterized protein MELLADRAFT_64773 [Melampsora larici-populina 98AG31]|uniref:Uncharacterized protein n=1 Tax=Melampsora larici-populina (strain 98AG31 / pathotype 3-4-7) TaxID=747676 RepID=F4RSQ8_MELLP|nr:uncharacterized protein MELLADRAFT_64773 [Melampsora larici-populina 98AG31]EGG04644.1 hypothetical protein MELLADRAFT_64773 [Melampsora larici-populina 98AG31]